MSFSVSSIAISMGSMVLSRMIDVSDPVRLNIFRGVYVALMLISSAIYFYIKQKVIEKNDTRKIWIEKKMMGVTDCQESTYVQYETEMADKMISSPIQGALMTLGLMSMYMKLHYGLLMQIIQFPYTLYKNPLFKKYILGMDIPKAYGETTECPISKMTGEEAKKNLKKAIVDTWDQCELADYSKLEELIKNTKEPNATTTDGWTPLMVLMGNTTANPSFVKSFLALGCQYTMKDNQGWTPLHWAAYHNNVAMAEALFNEVKESRALELCVITDKEGNTPYELAAKENQEQFVTWIRRCLDDYYIFLKDTNVAIPQETEAKIRSFLNNKLKNE
ncbi:hypothetical protein WA158_005399 [Blastocystis sp. Blastoise]